jgi:tripeptidyl-peptidase-1
MLFHSLVASLGLGLAFEVLASPLFHSDVPKKREVPASHAVHEPHTLHMFQQWAKRDKLSSTTVLPMRIGLKQSNLDMGHDRLIEM